jgi:hypothetical protein
MQKNKDIILGVLIGTLAFLSLVFVKPMFAVRAEEAEDGFTAAGSFSQILRGAGFENPHDRLNYGDVFGSATYENLYLMIYQFLLVDTEDAALKDVAQKYGLTVSEASAVKNGSIQPLLNAGKFKQTMTQEQLLKMAQKLQADFVETYELFTLKQEMLLDSGNSEVFSNGDLLDSGFDLVYDLSVIEKLLFTEDTEPTLGGPLNMDFSYKKKSEDTVSYYLEEEESSPALTEAYYALELAPEATDETKAETEAVEEAPAPEEESETGVKFNPETLVTVVEDDPCPKEETPIEAALDDYKEKVEEEKKSEMEKPGEIKKEVEGEEGVADSQSEPAVLAEKLQTPEPESWYKKLNCDGKLWSALYGSKEATTDEGENITSVQWYVCLETKVKWETYSSYVPVDKCINCELEKILAAMQKTLSHSLTPNKVTGNYMESSKCKQSMGEVSPIDIHLFLIWAPLQTPPQDDAIYGKSIIKEWNKFVQRANPVATGDALKLPESLTKVATEQAYTNASQDQTMGDLIAEIESIEEDMARQQANSIEQYEVGSSGEDTVAYSQAIMREVGQMTNYFKNFTDTFKKISTETCPEILGKKDVP